MKNTFGASVCLTLFGESHGSAVGCVIDGLAPGIRVDEDYIRAQLALRRPAGAISTSRREQDEFRILSGVKDGYTEGTPICIEIPNTSAHSADYGEMAVTARPGHADYTGYIKYRGYGDERGGGHFSGRLTAAVVAAGAIARKALADRGITLGTHIKRCAAVSDRNFGDISRDIEELNGEYFAVLDNGAGEKMQRRIESAAHDGDSVGGILESAVIGIPAGVGEPFFDTVEGVLSHALFAIPGIKGVEFGIGFGGCDLRGSEYNDALVSRGGVVSTLTNNNGGINGGITNGMPIIFRCAVKPTPSIFKEQQTVNFVTKENVTLSLRGRHDPAIIHRARAVVDAVTAFTLTDMLSARYGTDFFAGERK